MLSSLQELDGLYKPPTISLHKKPNLIESVNHMIVFQSDRLLLPLTQGQTKLESDEHSP